jgi:hypothetical protein
MLLLDSATKRSIKPSSGVHGFGFFDENLDHR